MRTLRTWIFSLLVCAVPSVAADVQAQPAYLDLQRDCQTLRNCNFGRGGVYRGCVSSYTCRVCRMVRTSCHISGTRRGVCQQMRCTWG